ncbi:N-(5'-phosphoribosyl)anthranilate isomerase [Skermanella stibiiresistens SB22]|uniref:N-(5'-phosphoribosyl)anthranilate isomerase n=1 Tax=Skermanella stibiiresistens SB22 TaxID=1385369 RepID=W9GUV4_9PROT|nr:phosphoribosylanthranilate isomerase [Skermanella stibiiresistens]EWY37589.1 N-(5'-phosphoribosyl)anthranilate isomerase [Skermanella stibiiresistens SB22]
MTVQVKICGVGHPGAVQAAVKGGARYIGLVFYDRSPRHVAPPLAAELARMVPTGVRTVGLFVDPSNEYLEHVVSQVPLDLIQLHGDESPARVAEIKAAFSMPVMKAIKVSSVADLDVVDAYAEVADRLLFDAKPPAKVSALPGGNGIAFDWTILTGRTWSKPWMLSGGLTIANVAEAIAISGAQSIDVSSGVEDRPGHKDPDLILDFLRAAGR